MPKDIKNIKQENALKKIVYWQYISTLTQACADVYNYQN